MLEPTDYLYHLDRLEDTPVGKTVTHSEASEVGGSAPPARAMADMHAYTWLTLTQHNSAWTAACARHAKDAWGGVQQARQQQNKTSTEKNPAHSSKKRI